MKKLTCVVLIVGFAVVQSASARNKTSTSLSTNLVIQVDVESALAIVHLMNQKTVTDAALDRTAALYGNRQLIRKVHSYWSSEGTEETFKRTLREVIQTGTVKGNDAFNWKAVKANQRAIQALINRITAQKAMLLNDISKRVASYTPATLKDTVRACFLAGGGALGFAFDGERTFYMALQKVGDDYDGLVCLVAHELYHSVQNLGQQTRPETRIDPPKTIFKTYFLLSNLYQEGTATLVGDCSEVKQKKTFAKEQQDEYDKNRGRRNENFILFSSLLYRAYYDSTASDQQLYNVAFTTAFDETSYYVGFEMAKVIEKYDGKSALAGYIVKSPLAFCRRYVELCRQHSNEDMVRFGTSVENIILAMREWEDKLR